ncbi:MAG TPA: ABC transporter substrate-binding protein [Nocardioidaceae bacterium]|nr:ABC transporter substrate-binding protein [Nocardioidaceae bacterium]
MTVTPAHRFFGAGAVTLVAAAFVGCAPTDESSDSDSDDASEVLASDCAANELPLVNPDQLTIATDAPAYEPYFKNNDPTNGMGFESAVAYAVADQMGFLPDQVEWVTVPFNSSYKPGSKDFDFDINQISITQKRAEAVTFSQGYYTAAQALITLKDSDYADATSLDDFADARLGAQVATTSLDAIDNEIQPSQQPQIFDNTNDAKQALLNDQVDAIVADLPTAFYITAVEIPQGKVVGQFQVTSGDTEEFGLLMEQNSALAPCVDLALTTLKDDGTLAQLEKRWMSDAAGVPELS